MSGGWGDHAVPSIARGWWNVPLELAGLLMVRTAWRRFDIADPARRPLDQRAGEQRDRDGRDGTADEVDAPARRAVGEDPAREPQRHRNLAFRARFRR